MESGSEPDETDDSTYWKAEGLSRMMRKCHVRFLGEKDAATCALLPDKKTAGVDGVKSLTPKQRLHLIGKLKLGSKVSPTRRVWIPKPGSEEKRPLGIPTIFDRAKPKPTKRLEKVLGKWVMRSA
ncbi:hypothetical protein [Scytonema sp. NUACC21]